MTTINLLTKLCQTPVMYRYVPDNQYCLGCHLVDSYSLRFRHKLLTYFSLAMGPGLIPVSMTELLRV